MAKQNFAKSLTMNTKNNAGDEIRKLESSKNGFNFKIVPYEKIRPSDKNKYPIEDIDEIAESIRKYGLMHNLLLIPVDDETGTYEYDILSGEQRYWSIGKLLEEGNTDFIPGVPSRIIDKNTSEIDQKIIIEEANLKQRNYDSKTMREAINRLDELYRQKNAEEGAKLNTTKQIAEKTGLKERQVQRYNAINKKLIPELQAAFDEQKIIIEDAAKYANMDEDSQILIANLLNSNQEVNKKEIELIKQETKKKEAELLQKISELQFQVSSSDEAKDLLEKELKIKEDQMKENMIKEENLRKQIEEELKDERPDQDKLNQLQEEIELLKKENHESESEKDNINKQLNQKQREINNLQKELLLVKKQNSEKNATVLSEEERTKLHDNYEIENILADIKKGLNQLFVKGENYKKKYNETDLNEYYNEIIKKIEADRKKI